MVNYLKYQSYKHNTESVVSSCVLSASSIISVVEILQSGPSRNLGREEAGSISLIKL